jgi:hypothetical protein
MVTKVAEQGTLPIFRIQANVHPECWYLSAGLQGAITQNVTVLVTCDWMLNPTVGPPEERYMV